MEQREYKQYPKEVIEAARNLVLQRNSVEETAKKLGIPARTIYQWAKKGGWKAQIAKEMPVSAANRRLTILVEKVDKTEKDYREIKNLTDLIVKLSAIHQRREERGESGDRASRLEPKRAKARITKKKNDVTSLRATDFKEKLHKAYFGYQKELRAARDQRTRFLLKARQIGATWYFAQEAFEDAALTGRNQIFLSATRAQAEVFRRYIISIAQQHFGIELKGNPIILNTNNGPAELHFLSNSSRSAQSYTGNVYIDECFWIQGFNDLYKVATGMSAHKKWRRTLFSTPSAVTHDAYDLWTGDRFNSRFKKKRVDFPQFTELQSGILCPDKTWRKIITLDDAEAGGCNLFDKEELKLEYSPSEYKNLFGCQFVDDTLGVFKFADLEKCGVDPVEAWPEIDLTSAKPVGNRPVWGGYDPSRIHDDASFVILLPPMQENERFKLIKRFKWVNKSFTWQADQIRRLTEQFNFQYIGLDVTGPGAWGVHENVQKFFPQVTPIHYSVSSKSAMVQKAQEVIGENRIEWGAEETTIAHAFLTIRQHITGSNQVTYSAHRTATTGHADVAWAIMHALSNEKIAHKGRAKAVVEVC